MINMIVDTRRRAEATPTPSDGGLGDAFQTGDVWNSSQLNISPQLVLGSCLLQSGLQ